MPIELHHAARQRVLEALCHVLRAVQVRHNSFLSWPSLTGIEALDRILPDRSDTQSNLIEYVGEEAISDFIIGRLSDVLSERDFSSDNDPAPLASIPDYADVPDTANHLLAELESLPWLYKVFTPVPWEFGQELSRAMEDQNHLFTESLRLVRLGDQEQELTRESTEEQSLLDKEPRGVHSAVLYLSETIEGYVPRFGDSTPLQRFEFNVRAFFGLALALRVAQTGSSTFLGTQERHILIYRIADTGVMYEHPHTLALEVGECIRSIGLTDLYGNLPEDVRPHFLKRELSLIGTAFANPRNTGVLRAAQWLFDSYASKNHLLAFVQATVSLEILFGEKAISDMVGLGELLANRVAYLIGTTRQQREEVLVNFRRIYGTRSRIVHRGHNRLSVTERSDLHTLRWMCSRAINKELELAQADQK